MRPWGVDSDALQKHLRASVLGMESHHPEPPGARFPALRHPAECRDERDGAGGHKRDLSPECQALGFPGAALVPELFLEFCALSCSFPRIFLFFCFCQVSLTSNGKSPGY